MTRYNLSKVMKLAHFLRKTEGYTMSIALKLAWNKAKRSEFYLIIEVLKPIRNANIDFMAGAANYYASKQSGAYTGD